MTWHTRKLNSLGMDTHLKTLFHVNYLKTCPFIQLSTTQEITFVYNQENFVVIIKSSLEAPKSLKHDSYLK